MTTTPIVRAVTVQAPASRAFDVFTDGIAHWWPLASYSLNGPKADDVAFVDGTIVETSDDGATCVWGTVLEWTPPHRVVFTWAPGGGPSTVVTVDFEADDDRTRVVLTHSGWEALGDDVADRHAQYSGDDAWVWVLDLYALAADGIGPDDVDGGSVYDVQPLRAGYSAVAEALDAERCLPPPHGEWSVRQVAGHVVTNAELMARVVDDVRRGRPARLHGPDDHAASAVDRFGELPLPEVAHAVMRAAAELVARCGGLGPAALEVEVSTYIEHRGVPVVDGPMTLGDLLRAEVAVHLPAHVAQIDALVGAGIPTAAQSS